MIIIVRCTKRKWWRY